MADEKKQEPGSWDTEFGYEGAKPREPRKPKEKPKEEDKDPLKDPKLFSTFDRSSTKHVSNIPPLEYTLEKIWKELTLGKRKLPIQQEVGPAEEEEDYIEIDTDQVSSKDLNPGMSGILTWVVEMLWQTGDRFRDKKIAEFESRKIEETENPRTIGIRTKRFVCGCILHTGLAPLWSLVMITKADKESLSKKRQRALDDKDKPFLSKFHKKSFQLVEGFRETVGGSYRIGYLSSFDKERMNEIQSMYGWNLSSIANIALVWGIACSTELFLWDTIEEARVAIVDFVARYKKEYDEPE